MVRIGLGAGSAVRDAGIWLLLCSSNADPRWRAAVVGLRRELIRVESELCLLLGLSDGHRPRRKVIGQVPLRRDILVVAPEKLAELACLDIAG